MNEHEQLMNNMTLGQLLDWAAEKYPDREALVFPKASFRITYKELKAEVDRMAKGLMALGVGVGQKVAIWATNVPYWVVMQFAIGKIGAIIVPVNMAYRAGELKYVLADGEVEYLCMIDGYRDIDYINSVYELFPEMLRLERGRLWCPSMPNLSKVIYMGPEKHRGMYSLTEVLGLSRMVSDEEYLARQARVGIHDVANIQYTSGTTGFPKGAMLTHHGIVYNAYCIAERMKFGEHERLCLPLPLIHCFGCVVGILTIMTHVGTTVVLETFDTLDLMQAVNDEKCTAIYGVPTMFIAALTHERFSEFDFSSLRTGIMAGAPCPVLTMQAVMDRMNMTEVTICYGMTENSSVMTQTATDDPINLKVTSVGRALPGIEVQVVNPDTGVALPAGSEGEICCRGYSVMKGYYKKPHSVGMFIDADNWMHSGDQGLLDENGYLYVTGRIKDMIIRGGENISPKEVEEFIYTMPEVMDVQVVGVPSKVYGEEVGAFIRLRQGAELTREQVRDYCIRGIARYKAPKHVFFVDAFPLNTNGKVQKFRLREQAAQLVKEKGYTAPGRRATRKK